MAKRPLLGLFDSADRAADAGDALKKAGIAETDYDFLTDAPYPEGAFGERAEHHRLYIYPMIGAVLGLTSGVMLTSMTQMAFPMVQGGKPILALPPMAVICYEGTMLGAILFTIFGILFESRLPAGKLGLYDTRITQGFIGVLVHCEDAEHGKVSGILSSAGAVEVKWENARAATA
ncbi:MAG: DUF3341 domain-containing protein [SAR202 cluster bacterium]|nr:DUF3341 domain-containing protein [SAR202 cluster bacterium]